jgi:hypothetical protein
MHADEALFSSASASIRVNLRAIPDSVAARRAGPSAPFCGKSIEAPFHELFTRHLCKVQFHLIPLNSTWFHLIPLPGGGPVPNPTHFNQGLSRLIKVKRGGRPYPGMTRNGQFSFGEGFAAVARPPLRGPFQIWLRLCCRAAIVKNHAIRNSKAQGIKAARKFFRGALASGEFALKHHSSVDPCSQWPLRPSRACILAGNLLRYAAKLQVYAIFQLCRSGFGDRTGNPQFD